ncbi:MAG: alpha-ketoacid dehydrogenase subunit beta [Planctomycetes bacterium]|jgi:2-oxoisovalerate dehydrogenase E1 component beta subunit|nr:alpha-ketoacid dehydrogenase subunit beta [Planctomycetota bacterium]
MAVKTVLNAVNDALRTALRHDERVVILGEDVGKTGGVFRATDGLQAEFGEARVFDTPLAEGGIIGVAIGMALNGLKPVPEIQFLDFIYPAFDQIVNEAAKFRYRSGGEYPCPLVIRSPAGGGIKGGHYHSQSSEAYFAHTPGLKVVMPSTPHDVKGLLLASIEDPDPVLFLEPKRIYHKKFTEEVPEGFYTVPIGKARTHREGDDVTLVAWGAMVHVCLEAAEKASERGVSCEVLDLRTIVPLDVESVLAAAKKTGRVVIVHEAPRTAGFGAEISAIIAERAIEWMEAPIARVAGFDTPFPYTLEHVYLPDAGRVLAAIDHVMGY